MSSSHTTSVSLSMSETASTLSDSCAYYTIVVGGKSFNLTLNSLYSDSPNFFTDVFSSPYEPSQTKTMYIDRDPEIFKDIARHLQGYYVTPRDEIHFTDLLLDATYYNLLKLKAQLKSKYIVNVGGKLFRIEQDDLEKDSPNFFTSIGFGHSWEPPSGLQPMVTPPAMPPPMLNHDPDLFADIVRYLQGYQIQIKDEVHRQNLLKDARFYGLRGLTEKLLESRAIMNGFARDEGGKEEILFPLKDLRTSCVILPEDSIIPSGNFVPVLYKSKTKEGAIYGLTLEVHNVNLFCRYSKNLPPIFTTGLPTPSIESQGLLKTAQTLMRPMFELEFVEKDLRKLQNIAKSIKATIDHKLLSVRSPELCAFEIDGGKSTSEALANFERLAYLIRKDDSGNQYLKLFVSKCIIRLFVKEGKIEMELMKCEAFSSQRGFNSKRDFLPSQPKIAI